MSDAVRPLKPRPQPGRRVAELFAGVGGFRLGLEGLDDPRFPDWEGKKGSGWGVVWSNQWEPSTKAQHASACYVDRFGPAGHVCEDIAIVLDEAERGERQIPEFDLLVGGFPCQDYSVAKVLSQSTGIHGKKGVLWWQIHRLLKSHRPKYVILENVDRLLKSPAQQRGRDFAIILWCLRRLGYLVEWRVVNAADYGFPQRRRRVFLVASLVEADLDLDAHKHLYREGVLAEALPIEHCLITQEFDLSSYLPSSLGSEPAELVELSKRFGVGDKHSRFLTGGVSWCGRVWTEKVEPIMEPVADLASVLIPEGDAPEEFFITQDQLEKWKYLKGSKKQERQGRDGFVYYYNEGPVAFPDPLDRPSRTVLTGEGGVTASRFKHVVQTPSGRLRRLTPVELERLNGFPGGWTDTGMTDARRAFMMGNALIVGIVRRIGESLMSRPSLSSMPTEVAG